MRGETTVHIAAAPDMVWAMVSDVTRMGEWSPECYACEWIDGATGPTVGARFRGHNARKRQQWRQVEGLVTNSFLVDLFAGLRRDNYTTTATVTEAEPGQQFAFHTGPPGKELTRWRYRLTASGDGTDVTESFETVRYPRLRQLSSPSARRQGELQAGIEATLDNLKRIAESRT